tara:strand:- start:47 stop:580 length:534 start_codon:yes stop_codon:yes gene_type:complete
MKHDLFSTPVWHIEGTPQQLLDELYQGAYRFKEKYPAENRSSQEGYQTPTFELNKFHPQGQEYINKVIDETFEKNFKINRSEWWYNINPKGAWNIPHSHPGADFALVLYVTDSDQLLTLMDPNYHGRFAFTHRADITPPTKKGDILIFPADLKHYVKPNQKEKDRISISMNLQLCGN